MNCMARDDTTYKTQHKMNEHPGSENLTRHIDEAALAHAPRAEQVLGVESRRHVLEGRDPTLPEVHPSQDAAVDLKQGLPICLCFKAGSFTKPPLFQRNKFTYSGNQSFESCLEGNV